MKFRLLQRQKVRQQMKMKRRMIIAAAAFAFVAVTVSLTFIFNIADVRRMFAQTEGVDRYWVGNSIYTNSFNNQWEVDAWELTNNTGGGSWTLAGDGTGLVTVDNTDYTVQLKNTVDGAPLMFPLDTVNGRLDLNVTTLTGGRTLFSVDIEQYNASGTYLATKTIMYPSAYCGYFVSLFYDFDFAPTATQIRFVVNVSNTSSTQGSVGINLFSYYNNNNDWKNPVNWASASGGAGGESIPGPTDNAIFDGTYNANCNINGSLNIGGITVASGYTGTILQNGNALTIGSNGITLNGGTFQGGSGDITVNGPLTISNASAVFKSTSGDLTLNGDFSLTAGTFTHNSGQVILGNDMTWTGSASLYDLTVSATTGTKTLNFASGTTVTVNNTLALSGSANLILNGAGTIAAKAGITLTNTGTNGGGTATVLVNGTGAQALTGNSTPGQGRLPKLTIDKTSGTVTITNTLSIGNNFTYVKGTTTLTGSTLAFGGTDLTIDAQGTSATLTLNNVYIDKNTSTTAGDFVVSGNVDVNSGATLQLDGFVANISGTTTVNGTVKTISATAAKTLNNLLVNTGGIWDCSTVDEEFNINGNIENYGTFLASNSTGTSTMYYLLGNSKFIKGSITIPRIEIDNPANNASYTNFDTLTVTTSLRGNGGSLIQNANAYLRLGILSNATDMALTTLNATAAGNTVNYYLATGAAQEAYATTYHHVAFSGSGNKTLRGAITANGDVSISGQAVLDVSASNYLINVKGNWTNTSLPTSGAPFNARTGTVTFTGATTQNISAAHSGGNAFYNLTFDNTSTTIPQITFGSDDNATGTLTLTAGYADLGGHTFTLGASPTVRGTLSLTSGLFLSGTFKRWFGTTAVTIGNVAGQLPIGYQQSATVVYNRSAYYGGTATTGGTVSARHVNATGNYDYPAPFQDNGVLIDVRHNMSWIMSSADGLDGSNLYLRLMADGIPGVTNAAMLRIVKQNGAAPGTSISGGGTNNSPFANKQNMSGAGFNNTFFVGSSWNTNPLPITLLSFTAVPDGNRVKLDWVTASEENNDYFTIERSADGVEFEEVLKKDGAGNSNSTLYYNDYDNSPLSGTSYYRLKQTDFNGQFEYSNLVMVQFDGAVADQDIEFNIFPNPASASFGDAVQFTLNLNGIEEPTILINVLDMSGRIAATKTIRSGGGILQDQLVQASELKAGMYTVVAVVGKKQITKKLIIQ